jgi:hypothetical protein
MPRSRIRLAALTLALAAIACAPSSASAQSSSPVTCPSFHVLHNDRIGALYLPAGPYTITVLNGSRLSCGDASELFEQFLEDYDGRLPRPWVLNTETATFTRGRNSTTGFRISPGGTPPGPPTPSKRTCPSYFTVLHNDRIGGFRIAKGRYRITLLSIGRISCARASRLFANFLQDWNGILPRPWFIDPTTGSFMRGSRHVGFRIKRWAGPLPPNGGGGRHPSTGKTRCPGTFRVLHNDSIGALNLPRGPYWITARGSISCARASRLFASFLEDFEGNLPRPWRLSVRTANFSRGAGGANGFQVKLAR